MNAGREYNDVEISQRTFREQYLKPFRMAMHADPAMVMTAFNAVDRRPVSGNKELLEGTLREEMGFSGTVDFRLGIHRAVGGTECSVKPERGRRGRSPCGS